MVIKWVGWHQGCGRQSLKHLAQSLAQAGNATGKQKSLSHPEKEQNTHGGRIGSEQAGGFINQENYGFE